MSRPAIQILKLDWQNSQTLGPDVVAAVKKLKSGEGPDLLTQGSTDFLQTLFRNDLVDEINISLFPLMLGKGKKLFGDGASPGALKLVSSKVSAPASRSTNTSATATSSPARSNSNSRPKRSWRGAGT